MPRARISLSILLILACIGGEALGASEDTCAPGILARLLLQPGQPVRPGQPVELHVHIHKQAVTIPMRGRLLGTDPKRSLHYFWDEKTHQVLAADSSTIRWYGKSPSSDEARSLAITRVELQEGETCAVHSTVNCIEFLQANGLKLSPQIEAIQRKDPAELFEFLKRTSVNVETYSKSEPAVGTVNLRSTPLSEQFRLVTRWQDQAEKRDEILKAWNFDSEVIRDTRHAKRLIEHLKSGQPAILDLWVREKLSTNFEYTFTSKQEMIPATSFKQNFPTSKRGEGTYPHSVLAVGYFEDGNMKGKILVVDSHSGSFSLWDAAPMIQDLANLESEDWAITLVSPKKTPSLSR